MRQLSDIVWRHADFKRRLKDPENSRRTDENMTPNMTEKTERFCNCPDSLGNISCNCGEEDHEFYEWEWEPSQNSSIRVSPNRREVKFHPGYSVGTAVIRGSGPCTPGRHYLWEIKMLSRIYGTDVVVGVGTSKVDLLKYSHNFCSFLGEDNQSWGYSYRGDIRHAGKQQPYGPSFGKGSIIGVHLDLWAGTLEFYLNRKSLGVAYRLAQNQALFPMVCSTTCNSAIRLITSMSWPMSLQLLCLRSLPTIPGLAHIPGLQAQWGSTVWWRHAAGKMKETPKAVSCDTDVTFEFEIVESDEENMQEKPSIKKKYVPRRSARIAMFARQRLS